MKGLIFLYPRAWRDHYGEEFAEILASQRLSLGLIVDIIGGAVDARLRPQVRTIGADMTTTFLKRCAAGGPALTEREQRIGATAMVVFSLVFAVLYVLAAYQYPGNELVHAFGIMAFPAALVVSMPFTYLKGQSRAAQAFTVLGTLLILAGASYLATLI